MIGFMAYENSFEVATVQEVIENVNSWLVVIVDIGIPSDKDKRTRMGICDFLEKCSQLSNFLNKFRLLAGCR